MNTHVRLLCCALALGALTACAPKPPQTSADGAATPVATQAPNDSMVSLHELTLGQHLDITLEGNPSTGYVWDVVQDGSPVLVKAQPPAVAADSATPPGLVGAAQPSRFRFVAAQAGSTEVKLVYHRPWEKDVAPIKTALYQVQVR